MPVKDTLVASARRTTGYIGHPLFKQFIAELLGTFTLLVVGNGCIASSLLAGQAPSAFAVCFCFGLGAMIAILAVGHISGAHINPAVTVGQAVMGVFPWSKVLLFVSGQYIGSILATIVLYFVYYDAILAFNPSQHPSLNAASIFATFPGPGLTIRGALFDQTVGTAMLLFAVSAICNTKGFRVPEHFQALFICFVITGLCMTFGLNCGAIFNPARDITPRLTFAILTGNWDVFELLDGHYWYVAGLIGPHLGAIIGLLLFRLSCDHRLPATSSQENGNHRPSQIANNQHVCQLKNEEPGFSVC